jgi:hypothetical protein
VAPAALLDVSDATRSWLVIADHGASCIRALDLTGVNPILFRIAGGGTDSLLWPGVGMPALQYAMGAPRALAYDANASAIIVATKATPFVVAVTLPSDSANATAWSLSLDVGGVSPACHPQGIAYNNASGTLYASLACGVADHAILSASCTLPASGLEPASTQNPSPTAMPTSTSSVLPAAASPSATPSFAGAVQSELLCYFLF